jgi:hypothetical protein
MSQVLKKPSAIHWQCLHTPLAIQQTLSLPTKDMWLQSPGCAEHSQLHPAAKFAIYMILFRSGKEDTGVYGAAGGLDDSLLEIMLLHHICCYLLSLSSLVAAS